MFRALCAHHQEVKIVFYNIWYHHTCRWSSGAQVERGLVHSSQSHLSHSRPTFLRPAQCNPHSLFFHFSAFWGIFPVKWACLSYPSYVQTNFIQTVVVSLQAGPIFSLLSRSKANIHTVSSNGKNSRLCLGRFSSDK